MSVRKPVLTTVTLFVGALTGEPLLAEDGAPAARLQIAVTRSLFHTDSDRVLDAMSQPFSWLVHSLTGLDAQVAPAATADQLGQWLDDNKVQIGIFQGIEFGWELQKHPRLRPLMLVVNQEPQLRACLIVRRDRGFRRFSELRSKTLIEPAWSRLQCPLFLEDRCRKAAATDPAHFFSRIARGGDVEEVLDDVVDGREDAALVEGVPWKCYQRRKPGRAGQLTVLAESESFPASVVVYREGTLDRATLRQFFDGMLRAEKLPLGREMLTLWKVTGFVPVPADYDQCVENIVRCYPNPERVALRSVSARRSR